MKAKILFLGKAKDRISWKIAREANLILSAREACTTPQKPWRFLQIAKQKTAKISESLKMVRLYREARTFFEKNS